MVQIWESTAMVVTSAGQTKGNNRCYFCYLFIYSRFLTTVSPQLFTMNLRKIKIRFVLKWLNSTLLYWLALFQVMFISTFTYIKLCFLLVLDVNSTQFSTKFKGVISCNIGWRYLAKPTATPANRWTFSAHETNKHKLVWQSHIFHISVKCHHMIPVTIFTRKAGLLQTADKTATGTPGGLPIIKIRHGTKGEGNGSLSLSLTPKS